MLDLGARFSNTNLYVKAFASSWHSKHSRQDISFCVFLCAGVCTHNYNGIMFLFGYIASLLVTCLVSHITQQ